MYSQVSQRRSLEDENDAPTDINSSEDGVEAAHTYCSGSSVPQFDVNQSSSSSLSCKYGGQTKDQSLHITPKAQVSTHRLHILCFIMHAFLIVFHVILLVVQHYQWERSIIRYTTDEIERLSVAKTVISQTFAIVYLTALLFVTQRVALSSFVSVDDVLSLHDKQSSWTGLGSAIMTSLNQFSARSSPIGVIAIMIYLLLTAGLKITTPSVFNVVPLNVVQNISINSRITLPNLNGSWDQDLIARSAGLVPILNTKTGLPALGLAGNVLYGSLDINPGHGNVSVTSHAINITCSYLTEQAKDSFKLSPDVDLDGFEGLLIRFPGKSSLMTKFIRSMAPNSFSRFPLPSTLSDNQMIWATSLPIADSNGNLAPAIRLPAPLNPLTSGLRFAPEPLPYSSASGSLTSANKSIISKIGWQALYRLNITELTLPVCKMGITKTTTILDAQTRLPLEAPPRKTTSTWTPIDDFEFASNTTELSQWNTLFENSPTTPIFHGTSACAPQYQIATLIHGSPDNGVFFYRPPCTFIDQAERFLYDRLGMRQATDLVDPKFFLNPAGNPLPDIPNVTVALHDFENVLEDYTAAIIWAGTHLNDSAVLETTKALIDEPAAHLQLVLLPIIAGLGFSCVLFLLTPVITMPMLRHKGPASLVGTLGVLEVLWLSKKDERFQNAREQIDETDEPSGKRLRKTIRQYIQAGKNSYGGTHWKMETSEGMNEV